MSFQDGLASRSPRGGGTDPGSPGPVRRDAGAAFDRAAAGGGSPLPGRDRLEGALGADFGDVRVHAGRSDEMDELGAEAATRGNDIVTADANPDEALLAHELTHVMQNREGRGVGDGVGEEGGDNEREAEEAERSVAPAAVESIGMEGGGDPDAAAGAAPDSGIQLKAKPEGETEQEYGISFGGGVFRVKVGGGKKRVTLSGYRRDFGVLNITALSGMLSQGKRGPKGRVGGTARLAGGGTCKVSGSFAGGAMKLTASLKGATEMWPGLSLTSAKIKLGETATGSGSARYAIPGVKGTLKLAYGENGFTGNATKSVRLPYLGKVTFDAEVAGNLFTFAANAASIAAAKVKHGILEITEGNIAATSGLLGGAVSGTFKDRTGTIAGAVKFNVQGLDSVTGSGTGTVTLADGLGGASASILFGADGVASATARQVPVNIDGVVAGTVDLDWNNGSGLAIAASKVDVVTPWGATATIEDLALAKGRLRGTAAVPLAGIPGIEFGGDSTIDLAVGKGAVSGKVGPLEWTSSINPALSGSVDLAYSSGKGLSGKASGTVAHSGGATTLAFPKLQWEAGRGLTGEAKLTSKDIGIDWTAAPFVTSLDGDATVLFERGGLVAGSSQLVATCTFGTVGIRVTDIGTAGIAADLEVVVNDLGPSVELSEPLKLKGRYADGQTSVEANGIGFKVVTSGEEMTLSGILGDTRIDRDGLFTAVDLELWTGPVGVAKAAGVVDQSKLAKADFTFTTPVFRYPVDSPVIEGSLTKSTLSYEQGGFAGGVAGDAVLSMVGAGAEEGTLGFDVSANAGGGLDVLVEGADIKTSLLTVERFHLLVQDGQISADIQASASEDLPFTAEGAVTGGWDATGMFLTGGFKIGSKPGETPDLDGEISVGYDSSKGLWASGEGSAVLDKERNFVVQAAMVYTDGSLWVSAAARGMWESKKPLVDLSVVMGPKVKALTGKVEFPVSGVPYIHGFSASLQTNAGLHVGTELSGVSVDAGMPAWDVLGDKPPKIDVGVQWRGRPLELGIGLQIKGRLLGHFVGATIGVEVGAKAGFDLTSKDPSVRAVGSWDEEGDIVGKLFADLPMVLQMAPEGWFKIVAGLSKWAVGVPTTKETWKPEPIILKELDPLHFEWNLEDMLGEGAGDKGGIYGLGKLTQAKGLDKRRDPLIKGMIDHNPKLKKVVDSILGAVEVFDYALEEGEVFTEWTSEFDARILGGESIESAQRNANFLEKLIREQKHIMRSIPQLSTNIKVMGQVAAHTGDLKPLRKAVAAMHRSLNDFLENCKMLEGMYGQPIDKVREAVIRSSKSQVWAHLNELTIAIAKGAG